MSSIRFRYVSFGIVVAAGSAALVACSSSGSSAPPADNQGTGGFTGSAGGANPGGGTQPQGGANPGGGTQAQGGTNPSGGTKATGGTTTSVGGATMAGDIKIVGSVAKCADTPATAPAGSVNACTMMGCTAAHCVPDASVPAGTDKTLLAKCPDQSYCIPDDYIATTGKFLPKTCKSLEGAEGRCISKCIPQVNVQLTTLPKDVCADTELCAPCFNPIDGSDTHACNEGCDTGPVNKTPVKFDTCGGGLGVCVPPSLVKDPTQLAALKAVDDPTGAPGKGCTKKDAAGDSYLCAPTLKAKDQSAPFPVCTPTTIGALLALKNMAGQAGGCVPNYIVPSGSQSLVAQDTCATGEKCAPCTNPLSTPTGNMPSGACPWP
jgi:hypothetical protein